MKNKRFYCEYCGNEVGADAKSCPFCGRIFSAVRCPVCSYQSTERQFRGGCPRCGYLAPKRDLSDSVLDMESKINNGKKESKIQFSKRFYIIMGLLLTGILVFLLFLYARIL